MLAEWNLHYAEWIIGDGEPDRHIGDVFDWFALGFWSEEKLVKIDEAQKSAVPHSDFKYRVVAEVVYVSENACIIDFGLKATTTDDLLPSDCRTGDFVTGEIGLRLPLVTEVGPEEEFKKLAYRWRINRISADFTPYVNNRRDESRIEYLEIPSTASVKASSYVLHCCKV
jgi:hypothetical protein